MAKALTDGDLAILASVRASGSSTLHCLVEAGLLPSTKPGETLERLEAQGLLRSELGRVHAC